VPDTPWSFEERNPRSMRRDPFEAEFFTGEEETEDVFGRTDALVRESIQNSLDARADGETVVVRFAISADDEALSHTASVPYVSGLIEHLDALGNDHVNSHCHPPMTYLVIEDFGTNGLCGDPARTSDPPHTTDDPESFYWFWRNVGRSGKSGTDRGRWGLGKTVFPATSRINALFGLTKRRSDGKKLLMGQAITRIHSLNGSEYEPEGFFHDPSESGQVQLPFEDSQAIADFERAFRLRRANTPGLSVVVPYPFDRVNPVEILRSVIVHYFWPILKGDLEVEVTGPGAEDVRLTCSTIRHEAARLEWKGRRADKKHAPPPFDFAAWAITQQTVGIQAVLNIAGEHRVPDWHEPLIPQPLLEQLQDAFEGFSPIAVRVPMTLEKKSGGFVRTHFDVFVQRDSTLDKGEDHFIRGGMTISKIATLSGHRGTRGLVVVEHKELSKLLGDAEGPAHTEWGTGETRPERDYVKWKKRVSFVKNSLVRLISLISPPPQGLDEDWLVDIFAIAEPDPDPVRRRRRRIVVNPPPPPPPPPPTIKLFEVVKTSGGFRIHPAPGATGTPNAIEVRVAYDMPDGNPLAYYSPFDFVFDEGNTGDLHFSHRGVSFEHRERNHLVLSIEAPDFDLEVSGFRTVSGDLFIRAQELRE
jgi:hypothetical protein